MHLFDFAAVRAQLTVLVPSDKTIDGKAVQAGVELACELSDQSIPITVIADAGVIELKVFAPAKLAELLIVLQLITGNPTPFESGNSQVRFAVQAVHFSVIERLAALPKAMFWKGSDGSPNTDQAATVGNIWPPDEVPVMFKNG